MTHDFFITGLTTSMSSCLYNFPNGRYGPITSTEKLQQRNRAKTHILTCNYIELVDKLRNQSPSLSFLLLLYFVRVEYQI